MNTVTKKTPTNLNEIAALTEKLCKAQKALKVKEKEVDELKAQLSPLMLPGDGKACKYGVVSKSLSGKQSFKMLTRAAEAKMETFKKDLIDANEALISVGSPYLVINLLRIK